MGGLYTLFQVVAIALCVLSLTTHISCQDMWNHQMLVENCNWMRIMQVKTTPGAKVTLETPDIPGHNLAANLTCKTYIFVMEYPFQLNMKVNKFDLLGPDECSSLSERMTLLIPDGPEYRNVTWCGKYFAQEMILPVGAVNITYNTGAFGEGSGFALEFKAVPSFSCYEWSILDITSQPGLLYSPNYPYDYESNMDCTITLEAPEGFYIQIRSLMIKIEESRDCMFDSLQIDGVKYCGDEPVDHVVKSRVTEVRFHTDDTEEEGGYILEYTAIRAEAVNCSEVSSKHNITVVGDTLVILENKVPSYKRSDTGVFCEVIIDAGTDDLVLSVTFPSDMSAIKNHVLSIEGDKETSLSGRSEIHTALRYLRSPSRRIIFSGYLVGDQVALRIEEVDEEDLPTIMIAETSMVWINCDVMRGDQPHKMFLTAEEADSDSWDGKSIEVRIYDAQPQKGMIYTDNDMVAVASNVAVYNGPDENCFELTRSCTMELRSETSIYSIQSDSLTIVTRTNIDSQGFWLYFNTTVAVLPPASQAPTGSTHFAYDSTGLFLNLRNLYCSWIVQNKPGYLIQLKAETNLDPDIMENSFVIRNDSAVLLEYYSDTGNGNLYSSAPLQIIVSILDPQENEYSIYFKFSYNILYKISGISSPVCGDAVYLQAKNISLIGLTPNYPDFYMSSVCTWIIKKDSVLKDIVIDFPDISCSDFVLNVSTGWIEDEFSYAGNYCNRDSLTNTFEQNFVKIDLIAKSGHYQPGFRFIYYTDDSGAPNNCNTTFTLSDERKYPLHGRFPDLTLRDIKCSYNLYPASYDSTMYISVDYLDFSGYSPCETVYIDVYRQTPFASAPKGYSWVKEKRLCGVQGEPHLLNINPPTPVWIDIHWSQPPLVRMSYELTAYIEREDCRSCYLTAKTEESYLTSPNYPDPYPNGYYRVWTISTDNPNDKSYVIMLDMLDTHLEPEVGLQCLSDSLIIYDGKDTSSDPLGVFCGTVLTKQLVSSGPYVTIKFTSDAEYNYSGFKIKYWTDLAPPPKPEAASQDSFSGAIIGFVVGMVLLILVIVVVILFIVRVRRRRRMLDRARDSSDGRENHTRPEPSVHMNRQNSSVVIYNPVIINSNMPPPSYPEVVNIGYTPELPPYSRPDARDDYNPPQYFSRYDLTEDSYDESEELPPPYSPSLPGGPEDQSNNNTYDNLSVQNQNENYNDQTECTVRLARDSDSGEYVTGREEYDDDEEDERGKEEGSAAEEQIYCDADPPADDTDDYLSTVRTPTTTLDHPAYNLAQPTTQSVYNRRPPTRPPAYVTECLGSTARNQNGERRRYPSDPTYSEVDPPADDDDVYLPTAITPTTPTTTLDHPVYNLAQPIGQSVYNHPPHVQPPPYETGERLWNAAGNQSGERRRIPSQSRQLGPL